jgi:hypothetical protein
MGILSRKKAEKTTNIFANKILQNGQVYEGSEVSKTAATCRCSADKMLKVRQAAAVFMLSSPMPFSIKD